MQYSHSLSRRKRQTALSQAPLQQILAPETSPQAPQSSARAGSGNWSFAQMPVQRQTATTDSAVPSNAERASHQENQTGLPKQLKAGVERLSGQSLDDVSVHYNSSQPAQLHALAYAQGTEIHMGPGQEKHLGHEAWHIVQQKQGRVRSTMQMKGVAINDDHRLEKEADVMGSRALQMSGSVQHRRGEEGLERAQSHEGMISSTQLRSGEGTGKVVQRAIGLEIEIPIPIDQLTNDNVDQIKEDVKFYKNTANPENERTDKQVHATGMIYKEGRIPSKEIRPPRDGFSIDADHDSRVMTKGWPPREGGEASIMEIVVDPPTTNEADFNTTMDNISGFINQLNTQTRGLTTRWVNAFGTSVSVGPMDYTDIGYPAERMPQYGLEGSVQVNIGIDPREYHSLIKWYANSDYARPNKKASNDEQAIHKGINADIQQAVNIGRSIIANRLKTFSSNELAEAGNLRGLRGWVTYLAFYLKRGVSTSHTNSSSKNSASILLKSPNSIFTTYGMTQRELNYFDTEKTGIIADILRGVGRNSDVGKDLNAVNVFNDRKNQVKIQDIANPSASTIALERVNAITAPTGVGPQRMGNTAVQNLPEVPEYNIGGGTNRRGGIVLEFRTLPGLYDGVESWRKLGLEFFRKAEERNNRNGISK